MLSVLNTHTHTHTNYDYSNKERKTKVLEVKNVFMTFPVVNVSWV